MRIALALGMVLSLPTFAAGALRLSGEGFCVTFSPRDGALTVSGISDGVTPTVANSGEQGLWWAKFADGSEVKASQFAADDPAARFAVETAPDAQHIRMSFAGPQIDVEVTARLGDGYVDLTAVVLPRDKVLLEFALPARLRFSPERVSRLVLPMNGNSSVGGAFNGRFFGPQPTDRPAAWRPQAAGPDGYASLYGGPLQLREDQDPPVELRVTAPGLEWLGQRAAGRLEGARASVNRPPAAGQADIILVDSPNGAYFSASHLGGKGLIWRIGGRVDDQTEGLCLSTVCAAIDRLAQQAPPGRGKLGLIALAQGPQRGGWTAVTVAQWRARLRTSAAVRTHGLQLVELLSPDEMLQAAASPEFLAILNPYGEWAPVAEANGMPGTVQAVGKYVGDGGNWFEVGGHPFYYAMLPVRYLSIGTTYPAGFADFLHLDTDAGSVSVYRVQRLPDEPWRGADDETQIFVPGRLACGGDERGGYFDRPFATYVTPGSKWRPPPVRMSFGKPAPDSLRQYCAANGITRPLSEKMSPDLLGTFSNAVLLKLNGNCADKLKYLHLLPKPTLIHFSDYLKGGFDKQYPDHLPPRSGFGPPQQMRELFDRAHSMGHLLMPYTNPTWWCYEPKGPTFAQHGEAPLLKRLDGTLSHERYGTNPGYTVCHWHPAVQAANRKTLRQFTEEYPVDILFQDQCGARGWHYDGNPASPTPYAYTDGLISMVQEDSKAVPLSTESGWDRVANHQAQLCGMTWGIVPTEGGPSWRTLLKYDYPPDTWEIFPIAQYIAHDKCAMIHHDLGQFVTNQEVLSWTLGLGFNMSYTMNAAALGREGPANWLAWLDRLQKSICSAYTGKPVVAFEHERGPEPTTEDDGIIRAQYGPVQIISNLGPTPRTVDGHALAANGFHATAPGVVAGCLKSEQAGAKEQDVCFVTQRVGPKTMAYVYSVGGRKVSVELPASGGSADLEIPDKDAEGRVAPPPDLAGKAPVDWPGPKPAIGIIDLGSDVRPSWTEIQPADWLQAFRAGALAGQGVPIKRLNSAAAVADALEAGPRRWLGIINPYGEVFPAQDPTNWAQTLDRIKGYVAGGGSWWETAGYSFYTAAGPGEGAEPRVHAGPAGLAHLGIPVGSGEVDAPAVPLRATSQGRRWLGEKLAGRIASQMSPVNRWLPTGTSGPRQLALVAGEGHDYIGGYRLGGWGWLWRIGGFGPDPSVALPVVVRTMEYIYTHAPEPAMPSRTRYLWSFDIAD